MTSIADTLRAIEARAERAIVQELKLMMQEVLGLRTLLVLHDRSHADALLLKLDRLAENQMAMPAGGNKPSVPLMPDLSVEEVYFPAPRTYKVSFYSRTYGDLTDIVMLEAFDVCVQLVLDRVNPRCGHAIEASWVDGRGALTVLTPSGDLLAKVETVNVADIAVDAIVTKVCESLRAGDASRIEQLFGLMLRAA